MVQSDSSGARAGELEDWFQRTISAYRSAPAVGSELKSGILPAPISLADPCQIHVIWTLDPEFQFVVQTNLSSLPDRLVRVLGPVPIWEGIDQIETLLKNDLWDRLIETDDPSLQASNLKMTLRSGLESWFVAQLINLRSGLYYPRGTGAFLEGAGIGKNCSISLVGGTLSSQDAADYGRRAAEAISRTRPQTNQTEVKPLPVAGPKLTPGAVTYFYPPIYVGEIPKPKGIRERLTGAYLPLQPDRIVDLQLGRKRILIHRNGYTLVIGAEPSKCLEILNVLFAVARLKGLQSQAVSQIEIGGAQFDRKSDKLTTWWQIWGSPRWTFPIERTFSGSSPPHQHSALETTDVALLEVAKIAREVLTNREASTDLRFWLEGATRLETGEFDPSFVLSWIVVERWIDRAWRTYVKSKGVGDARRGVLTRWTAERQLQALELAGELTRDKFENLMALKASRNELMHEGTRITKDVAVTCSEVARGMVASLLPNPK